MMTKKLLGVDVGGTTIKFGIFNPQGEMQDHWSINTNPLNNGSRIIPDIATAIRQRLALYKLTTADFYGVGLDFPGTITQDGKAVKGAFHLNWQQSHPVTDELAEQLQLPVEIENDANAAALGENWQGAGHNNPNMLLVTLGTGVGAGIIAGGRLQKGAGNSAGEIGHICVEENGFKCSCGNRGCLEEYASATGIVNVARKLAEEYVGKAKLKALLDNGEEVSSKTIVDLAKKGDYLANLAFSQSMADLGLALSFVSNTLNPRSIVIGGGVSAAGDFLLSRVRPNFEKHLFPTMKGQINLRLAKLGNRAGLIGAVSQVLKYVDDAELSDSNVAYKHMVFGD